jgi:3-hydroxyacyl-[acyl-carrier-protein] dehydratase
MLKDHFFTIVKQQIEQDSIKASLAINQQHTIFNGHFPSQPIVPGVCMMQMIRELVELYMKKRLRLRQADNIKFMSVMDPRVNNLIEADVSIKEVDTLIYVTASLFSGPVTFFKLKAALQITE